MTLDPYELRHLVAHLDLAGNTAELHRLLTASDAHGRNLWFGLKDVQGDVDGYRRDVDRAQRTVRRVVDMELDEGRTTRDIGREVHYLLLSLSVVDQVGNMPPELFAAMVAKGVWSPETALRAASGDVGAVASLLRYLPTDVAERAVTDALATVSTQPQPWDRSNMLAQLAPHLTARHGERAVALLAGLPGHLRRKPAERLAGRVRADQLRTVVDLVTEIDDVRDRSQALAAIGEHVADDVDAITAAADTIVDPDHRAVALSGIIDRLSSSVLPELLAAMATEREDRFWRARALELLRPSLSDELLPAAMTATDNLEGEVRLAALIAIAPVLTPELASTALRTALAADGLWGQDELIIALTSRLSSTDVDVVVRDARRRGAQAVLAAAALVVGPAERATLFSEAVDILEQRLKSPKGARGDPGTRKREARTFAELPTELLGRAVELVEGMSPEMAVALAERLSQAGLAKEREQVLRTTLHTIRDWQSDHEDEDGARFRAMTTIAPALSRTLRWDALTVAGKAGEDRNEGDWRAVQLVRTSVRELVPYLDADQLSVAVSMIREIRDAVDRSAALTGLLAYLGEPERTAALEWTLAVTDEIIDPYDRRDRIVELAPILPARSFERILAMTDEIDELEIMAETLARIGDHVPAELVLDIDDLLADVDCPRWTSLAYARLAHRVTGKLRRRFYARAVADFDRLDDDEWVRQEPDILRALLPVTPDDSLPDLRAKADRIYYLDERARFLVDLAARLKGRARAETLTAALATARQVERLEDRAKAIAAVGEDVPGVLAAIDEIDDVGCRNVAFAALGRPVSAESVLQLEHRMREESPGDNDALARNRQSFVYLASRAPVDLVPHLLGAVKDLPSELDRVDLLLALAPRLPEDLLPAALQALDDVDIDLEDAAQVLATLTARFRDPPGPELKQLWGAARSMMMRGRRQDALTTLGTVAELVALTGGEAGVKEAAQAVHSVGEWFP
ncbi:hypothetical protein O7626_05050 [Micromonospora sp. WMMD1102]|uniref:hypothetical protein n=1 Tax=Micromonospora sp. WMMD1102 TaxID=3016105 RepID=UPI0024151D0C|nr:hypothetical protein [Micromonospora sp. WMMD1102]MDG4785304.1 hypothetical protein [Micromonospora sp. WMMD1102]